MRFSQFLYDDIIRSRLHKDIKWFNAAGRREELDNQYPYARAAKFHADIRKLGVNEHNETYLDRFRKLITQIGNAMGYVRMVRTAGIFYDFCVCVCAKRNGEIFVRFTVFWKFVSRCCPGRLYVSNAIRFVPDLEGILKFEELLGDGGGTVPPGIVSFPFFLSFFLFFFFFFF